MSRLWIIRSHVMLAGLAISGCTPTAPNPSSSQSSVTVKEEPATSSESADGSGPYMQVLFSDPIGARVLWETGPSGTLARPQASSTLHSLVIPGSGEFQHNCLYRLKVENVYGHTGLSLYPTLEIRQQLLHRSADHPSPTIAFQLSDEDLGQLFAGNTVTKVTYQADVTPGAPARGLIATMVSTDLAPDVDPVIKADRLGSILAILRIGPGDIVRGRVSIPR